MRRSAVSALVVLLISWNLTYAPTLRANDDRNDGGRDSDPAEKLATATPIKHLVVIFQENESFDHYFGTYPKNDPLGTAVPPETAFDAAPDTLAVNGLTTTLLTNNPNLALAGNPFLLTRAEAATCDNTNKYTPEQEAFDGGLLDKFNLTAPSASTLATCGGTTGYYVPPTSPANPSILTMGYYDGYTVTGLWNYAQHYAMSDNFFDTEFGGTVEGHLNLLSGQTNGLVNTVGTYPNVAACDVPAVTPAPACLASGTVVSNNTVINNLQPTYDDCAVSQGAPYVYMTGHNVGDLLNKGNVTWGWFYDGFRSAGIVPGNPATCSNSIYNSHYAPLQYWPSTSNPHHFAPTSTIGTTDAANHNYDLSDLCTDLGGNGCTALAINNLPAVTFIKASKTNTGHPMDSTPLAEQEFLVNTINTLEESPDWKDMAIIVAYDDSDGWYDHVAAPIINHSNDSKNDAIVGTTCGTVAGSADNDRCGFGVRLPFLLISPFAKHNYVDHSLNDTTSIMRFIEYNWKLGTLGGLGVANDLQSYDVMASGSILGMFDFDKCLILPNERVILSPITGEVTSRY